MISDVYLSTFLAIILLIAAIYDIWVAKIPNVITFSGMITGIIYHGAAQGLSGAGLSIAGLLAGSAVFFPFYLLKGMGAGDIKLMGAVGSLVAWKGIIPAIVFTALAGGIYAFALIFCNPSTCKRLIFGSISMFKTLALTGQIVLPSLFEKEKKPQVRYGVAIAAGTLFSQWWWPLLK
ncbi:MAG: prepilin peptidase [Thermodesulfobacteriota bacterium]|nr:MAG: prepilin peptidase [Thermodesulfobacteriota bacterium]